ncbi:hypothetical protein HY375_01570 [Candidatus Berkelbacteria bacterium]|nr:hypothetical protein [Candidatus Berkelbacteria bacterium]
MNTAMLRVAANTTGELGGIQLEPVIDPKYGGTLVEFFTKGVPDFLLGFAGLIALVMLLIGGLWYLFNAGNSDATGQARNTMLWSLIGLLVVLLSYAALNFIRQALGSG